MNYIIKINIKINNIKYGRILKINKNTYFIFKFNENIIKMWDIAK